MVEVSHVCIFFLLWSLLLTFFFPNNICAFACRHKKNPHGIQGFSRLAWLRCLVCVFYLLWSLNGFFPNNIGAQRTVRAFPSRHKKIPAGLRIFSTSMVEVSCVVACVFFLTLVLLGSFGCYRIHLNSHVSRWIRVKFSLSSTPIHPNICRLMRIRLYPNDT
jgi:hypothetical protein